MRNNPDPTSEQQQRAIVPAEDVPEIWHHWYEDEVLYERIKVLLQILIVIDIILFLIYGAQG